MARVQDAVGGKSTRCFVDTGAQISTVSLHFFKKTCIDINYVVGVGNHHLKILGSLDIPISILGVRISYTFYILEQLWHVVNLGMDFLKHHNIHIDLDKKNCSHSSQTC